MAAYYTYKHQVHLKPGEKLGFTPGRGYYAIPAPKPEPHPTRTSSRTEELGGITVSQAIQVGKDYGLPTRGADEKAPDRRRAPTSRTPDGGTSQTTPSKKHSVQPSPARALAAKAAMVAEAPNAEKAPDYRTIVFQTATRANPTAELLKTAHRQSGTVAHPTAAKDHMSPSRGTKRVTRTESPHARPHRATIGGIPVVQAVRTAVALPTMQRRRITASAVRAQGLKASGHVRIDPTLGHLEITVGNKRFVNRHAKISARQDRVTISVGNQKATIFLTKMEKTEVSRLRNVRVGGTRIVNPLLTAMAAKIAGLPLPLACAILQQETAGGANEWGHDPPKYGAIFSGGYDQAHGRHYREAPITKSAYAIYKSERGAERAGSSPHQQGVGPGQLTSAWKQDQADLLGGAWKPLPNMIEAFALLRASIQRDGLRSTIVSYNGSGPKAERYADAVLGNEQLWAQVLKVRSMQDG